MGYKQKKLIKPTTKYLSNSETFFKDFYENATAANRGVSEIMCAKQIYLTYRTIDLPQNLIIFQ